MTLPDPCCDPVPLDGPDSDAAGKRLALAGFVALWRGETVRIADLADDPIVVETLQRGGRVEIDDAGVLVGIHGLVARPTRHRIEHRGGAVHTWCALDAIGIPAALGVTAEAVTSCPGCDAELRVRLTDGRPEVDQGYVLWLPEGPCGHLVEDFCNHTNLYCTREHLDMTVQHAPGRVITVADTADIGRDTWADAAKAILR
jgi:hypothetical protein